MDYLEGELTFQNHSMNTLCGKQVDTLSEAWSFDGFAALSFAAGNSPSAGTAYLAVQVPD